MKKEDKSTVIEQIAATLKEYSHFYLTETSALNAEKTSALRRECIKNDIKMLVVKMRCCIRRWKVLKQIIARFTTV